MNASKTAMLTLVLIGLFACTAKTHQGQRAPICVGPVCLDKDIWKDAEPFFKKYGVGVERKGKFPAYWYNNMGTYVYIGRYHGENKPIDTIVVSKYPYYSKHALPPKQPFGPLTTEKGIGIGDSYTEVTNAYGPPDDVYTDLNSIKGELPEEMWDSLDLNKVVITRYENTFGEYDHGPWSLFIFEKDVLIAIELSNAL